MLPPARNRCNTSLARRDSTVFTCYHLLEIGLTHVLLVGTVLCSCISGRGRLTHAATVNSKESNYSYIDVFQMCFACRFFWNCQKLSDFRFTTRECPQRVKLYKHVTSLCPSKPWKYSKNCQTSSIAVKDCAFRQTKRPVFSSINIFLFSTVRPRVEEFLCIPGKCGGGAVASVNVK